MQEHYESFHPIKSHETKNNQGKNEASSYVMGQTATKLPIEQPHTSATCIEKVKTLLA